MYHKLLFALLCIFFIGCSKSKNERTIDFSKDRDFRIINVFNEQKYTDLEQKLPNNIKANAESEESYATYSYLSLKANNEYTFLIGNKFMYGTFSVVNKDEIVLKSTEFGEIPLKIMKEEDGCIQIHGDFKAYKSDMMIELDGNTKYYLNLNTDFKQLGKENDIRSVTFNQWRFQPKQKETDQQIKQRLIANLKYIAAYMRVHMYGEFNQIHTAGIHSPFLYARNGLFLYEWQRVPYFWKHVFYDENDAEKAYKLLHKTFNNVEPPKFIDNWLAYNESCLQTLINKLEEEKEENLQIKASI